MGNVSWQFKKFADATSKQWFTRAWSDKVFGGFTNSASPNGDKQVALITLQTLASQHGGIWVSLGLAPSNTKASTIEDINNLGGSVGLLTRAPADANPDEVHGGDLKSAALYGARGGNYRKACRIRATGACWVIPGAPCASIHGSTTPASLCRKPA
jgi:multimeric flavodoxin WrbA